MLIPRDAFLPNGEPQRTLLIDLRGPIALRGVLFWRKDAWGDANQKTQLSADILAFDFSSDVPLSEITFGERVRISRKNVFGGVGGSAILSMYAAN